MTGTAVVLGIAMLGTPEAVADYGWAADAIGSVAMRKVAMNFIGLSSRFRVMSFPLPIRVRSYSYGRKKTYSSAKLFMKKFLASINICSRF